MPLRLAQYAMLFVSALIVTRVLGPDGRAQYALPLAFTGALWVATHLTLELAASRMLARRQVDAQRLARTLALCFAVISVLTSALAFAVGSAVRSEFLADATLPMVALSTATVPFLLAAQLAGQILVVRGRLRAHGTAMAVGAALQLAVTVGLLVADRITPTTAIVTALVGFAATGTLLAFALGRDLGGRALVPAWDPTIIRPLLRTGAVLHPGSVALQLDPRISLVLVGALLTEDEAGLYSLALSLMATVLLASQTLSVSAVHPQYSQDEAPATEFTLGFARQSLLVALAAALPMAALAYPLIIVLYGSDFAGATLPFVILLLVALAISIESPCRVLLVRLASPRVVSSVVCLTILFNAGATITLAKALSVSGAALASALSYWLLALVMLAIVTRRSDHSMREFFQLPHPDDEVVRGLRRALRRHRPSRA
jgi:O-antigen/teichoic acid export membrane protein